MSDSLHRRTAAWLLGVLLGAFLPAACPAADPPPPPDKAGEKPGEWVPLRKDGTPWKHQGSDLRFPQHMGDFSLRLGFQDKRPAAGVALSYTHDKEDIKGDIVLFPCGQDLNQVKDLMAFLRAEHDKLVKELRVASKDQGYVELRLSAVEEKGLNTWTGPLPMTVQTLEFGPADPATKASKPEVSQWLGLLIYQDHFVQISIVRPTDSGAAGEKLREELVKLVLQCVREPSLTPEMLKLCRMYVDKPFTKEGRDAADHLLAFSRESPVFKIIFPGDVLTPALDEVSAVSKESGLDLLRSFIVGSGVVALQNGTADQSLEGGRLMAQTYHLVRKENEKISSALLEELSSAEDKQRGAVFLRMKMAEQDAAK